MKNSWQTSPDSKFKYKLVEFEKERCCFRKRCYLIHQNSYKFQILNARRGPNIEQDKKFTYTPTRKKNQRILKILGFLIQKQNLDGFFPVNYQPKKKTRTRKGPGQTKIRNSASIKSQTPTPNKDSSKKIKFDKRVLTNYSTQNNKEKTIKNHCLRFDSQLSSVITKFICTQVITQSSKENKSTTSLGSSSASRKRR
jgi:hypothetical protein